MVRPVGIVRKHGVFDLGAEVQARTSKDSAPAAPAVDRSPARKATPPPPATHPSRSVAPKGAPACSAVVDVRPRKGALYAPDRVLFMGDSQSVGLRDATVRNYPEAAKDIDFQSLWGRTTQDFLNWLGTDDAKARIAARDLVVVQVGGNDLRDGRTAEEIITAVRRIVARIRVLNPEAKVVVSTVPARWRFLEEKERGAAVTKQRRLDEINRFIGAGGDVTTRFGAFDVNAIVGQCNAQAASRVGQRCEGGYRNEQLPAFQRAEADVHLNDAGYDAVADALLSRYVAG